MDRIRVVMSRLSHLRTIPARIHPFYPHLQPHGNGFHSRPCSFPILPHPSTHFY
jgi:hypothetical protein